MIDGLLPLQRLVLVQSATDNVMCSVREYAHLLCIQVFHGFFHDMALAWCFAEEESASCCAP